MSEVQNMYHLGCCPWLSGYFTVQTVELPIGKHSGNKYRRKYIRRQYKPNESVLCKM